MIKGLPFMLRLLGLGVLCLALHLATVVDQGLKIDGLVSAAGWGVGLFFLFLMGLVLVALKALVAGNAAHVRDMLGMLGMGLMWLALQLVVFDPADGLNSDGVVSVGRGISVLLLFLVGVGLVKLRVCIACNDEEEGGFAGEFALPVAGVTFW